MDNKELIQSGAYLHKVGKTWALSLVCWMSDKNTDKRVLRLRVYKFKRAIDAIDAASQLQMHVINRSDFNL